MNKKLIALTTVTILFFSANTASSMEAQHFEQLEAKSTYVETVKSVCAVDGLQKLDLAQNNIIKNIVADPNKKTLYAKLIAELSLLTVQQFLLMEQHNYQEQFVC